ncbi:MAG TPA: hypothetical protein VLA52_14485 [Thermohalobaculum sp.]|nr:hypothetical protein [Thermohalobaculum sp.]
MWRAGALLLAASLLPSCQTAGLSGRDAEIERVSGERNFEIIAEQPDRVVFSARGQYIAVEPPDGYCIDRDAIELTRMSAFMLISDCLAGPPTGAADTTADSGNEIEMPRTFPGILTVSISGAPALSGGAAALDEFEELLTSPSGKALLGRGTNGTVGNIVATRRSGGAVYVLIEEDEKASQIFAPRFWRGFIDINERLVLVTVSGFNDRPAADDGMLAFVATQIARLRKANGLPEVQDELKIAAQLDLDRLGPPIRRSGQGALVAGTGNGGGRAPESAPRPSARFAVAETGAAAAPRRAPVAPQRPG